MALALEDRIIQIREEAIKAGTQPIPDILQGIAKNKIKAVLQQLDLTTSDQIDTAFSLLDNISDSWFSKTNPGTKFADGATTAHIACHVGILQRGGRKLDREGRDYWLKPFWEIGAFEKVFFDSITCEFIPGHPVAKSPNCGYKISESFKTILLADDTTWPKLLAEWSSKEQIRQRKELQAKLAQKAKESVDTHHSDLIKASGEFYVPTFLPGYEIIYIDDGDGDRITEKDKAVLSKAGIDITLHDAMPDILLWNPKTNCLWVIEAVTSDGEVDVHKVKQLSLLSSRSRKVAVGFTTTYKTWKDVARRQSAYKNIAPDTYIWVQEDPSKQFLAKSF